MAMAVRAHFLVCSECGEQAVPWDRNVFCLSCGYEFDNPITDNEPFRAGWDESD